MASAATPLLLTFLNQSRGCLQLQLHASNAIIAMSARTAKQAREVEAVADTQESKGNKEPLAQEELDDEETGDGLWRAHSWVLTSTDIGEVVTTKLLEQAKQGGSELNKIKSLSEEQLMAAIHAAIPDLFNTLTNAVDGLTQQEQADASHLHSKFATDKGCFTYVYGSMSMFMAGNVT
jgi:hypothetical protein